MTKLWMLTILLLINFETKVGTVVSTFVFIKNEYEIQTYSFSCT